MAGPESLQALIQTARAPLTGLPSRYPSYRFMGYLCSYVPEEMLHAAGFAPVRLRGSTSALRQVDAHLQSFSCALCRSTLDQLLQGEFRFLAGTVFAHTCDTMQALADLWRMNATPAHFVDTIMQPANLGTPAARPYLIAELGRVRGRLAAFSGQKLTDDGLRTSISLFDETRSLVGELGLLRDRLTASEFYAVVDAAQTMPRELVNSLLSEVIGWLPSRPASRAAGRHTISRLFLAGAVLDEPHLLDLIEEAAGCVAGDDLCSGSRHFHSRVGTADDPLAALADYYLGRPPCPTKLHPAHDPGRYLLQQAQRCQADGVVFVLGKFCEPHAFDYALVLPAFEQAGLPTLLLEMEHLPSMEALRTRLQAFIETLR